MLSENSSSGVNSVEFDGALDVDSSAAGNSFKTQSKYDEAPVDNFSRVFSAYKRQSAGVIREYRNKQEYHSRSEWRKIKDENSRKRNAKKSRNYESRGSKYF